MHAEDWDERCDESEASDFDEDGAGGNDDDAILPCPYCGEPVFEDAPRCPYCNRYISENDTSPRRKSL